MKLEINNLYFIFIFLVFKFDGVLFVLMDYKGTWRKKQGTNNSKIAIEKYLNLFHII